MDYSIPVFDNVSIKNHSNELGSQRFLGRRAVRPQRSQIALGSQVHDSGRYVSGDSHYIAESISVLRSLRNVRFACQSGWFGNAFDYLLPVFCIDYAQAGDSLTSNSYFVAANIWSTR